MILIIAGALAIIEMEWHGIMAIMIVISIILIIAMIICSLLFNGCLSSDVNGIHANNAYIPPIQFHYDFIVHHHLLSICS